VILDALALDRLWMHDGPPWSSVCGTWRVLDEVGFDEWLGGVRAAAVGLVDGEAAEEVCSGHYDFGFVVEEKGALAGLVAVLSRWGALVMLAELIWCCGVRWRRTERDWEHILIVIP
jgi:hypothetical protein